MTDNQQEPSKKTEPAIASNKKPYQKPEFRYEKVFETMALACGKVSSLQGGCRFNRKNS
jgi:hypothetical protein